MHGTLPDGSAAQVVDLSQTLGEVERVLQELATPVAIVCDAERYVGIVRRSQIDELLAESPDLVTSDLNYLGELPSPVVFENSSPLTIRRFIFDHDDLPVVPFIDRSGRLTRALSREEALRNGMYPNAVVIMAGGFGVRLHPITASIPKPMLPLVDGTLIDRILDHLLDCGFSRYYAAVHYLKEQIIEYLGDGRDRGVRVEYLIEESPLGTAGSLRALVGREDLPIVVTNGDVITNQRFGEILRYHRGQRAQITMVCKQDSVNISYGVVECASDGTLASLSEKPRYSYLVNTGMYIIEPDVLDLVPDQKYFMTDLIKAVRARGGKVSVLQSQQYWRDVGTIDAYAQVIKDIRSGLVRPLLPVRRNSQGTNNVPNGSVLQDTLDSLLNGE